MTTDELIKRITLILVWPFIAVMIIALVAVIVVVAWPLCMTKYVRFE